MSQNKFPNSTYGRGDPAWDHRGGDGYRGFWVKDPPGNITDKYFWQDYHIWAAFLQTDRITYYLDGKVIGIDTENPAFDFGHGGVNHVMGVMNRSWETSLTCDWMRWTPEATMLSKLSSGGGGGGGSGGGGTTAPPPASTAVNPDLPGPGGGTPGDFGFQLQGQWNAVFFYTDALPTGGHGGYHTAQVFNRVLQSLTGLSDAQASINAADNVSVVGGTGTNSLGHNDNVWLRGYDQDWGNPSTWLNNSLMTNFLNWSRNEADKIPAGRPIALIRMYTEYDSRNLTTQAERDVYEAASREFIKRWRDRIGRGAALTPVFLVPVPYYADGATTEVMWAAWRSMCADPALNCYMGVGSTMDVSSREAAANGGNDYLSHWDTDGSARVARRTAVRVAKWMHANGYSARDLTNLPTFGPRYASFARVAGAANRLDLVVAHDGGTDLTVPGNVRLDSLDVNDNGVHRGVVAIARQSPDTVRITLESDLSASGPITVDYGKNLWYFDEATNPGGTIYDNRHTLAWPVSDAEVANTRMNLQRLRLPLKEGAADGVVSPPPSAARSIKMDNDDPNGTSGAWSATLTVAGIARVAVRVQNDANSGWSYESVAEYPVPADGRVPITVQFTKSGQFLEISDAADQSLAVYSKSSYF